MGSPAIKDNDGTMTLREAIDGLLHARTKGEVEYFREQIEKSQVTPVLKKRSQKKPRAKRR